jgi:hypothetical protein
MYTIYIEYIHMYLCQHILYAYENIYANILEYLAGVLGSACARRGGRRVSCMYVCVCVCVSKKLALGHFFVWIQCLGFRV